MLEWINKITCGHVSEAIIIAATLIILHVLISIYMACTAKQKGYNDTLHFFISLLFGIFGYIYIAALPDRRLRNQIEELYDILDELAENLNLNAEGLIAETGDNRKPSGTTAYMPRSTGNSETSAPAVDRIKKYWEKANHKDAKPAKQDKKEKAAKKKEKAKDGKDKNSFD